MSNRRNLLLFLSLIILSAAGSLTWLVCAGNRWRQPDQTVVVSKVDLQLFIMPHCPYGQKALRDVLDIVEGSNNLINLSVYFIAHRKNTDRDDSFSSFESMHGLEEVRDGVVACIVERLFPEKYHAYLDNSVYDPEEGWRFWADKAKVPVSLVSTCLQTKQALSWYAQNISVSQELGVTRSPTIYMNGQLFRRAFDRKRLRLAICRRIPIGVNSVEACVDLPECIDDADCSAPAGALAACEDKRCVTIREPQVRVEMLTSEKLSNIHTDPSIEHFKRLVPSAEFSVVPIESNEGMAIGKRLQTETLPVFVMDEVVKTCRNYKVISRFEAFSRGSKQVVVVGCPVVYPFRTYGVISYDENGIPIYKLPLDMRGAAFHAIGQFTEAEELYEEHLNKNPTDVRAMTNLGAVFAEQGKARLALELFKKAVAVDPDYLTAFENLLKLCKEHGFMELEVYVLVQEAHSLLRQGRLAESAKLFHSALKKNANLPVARYGLGRAYLQLGEYQKARDQIRHALRMEPNNVRVMNSLACALWHLGDRGEAIRLYRQALDREPGRVTVRVNLVRALQADGNLQEAVRLLTDAPRACKDDMDLEEKLMELYVALGEPARAIIEGKRLLAANKSSTEVLYWMAKAQLAHGQKKEARQTLRELEVEDMDDTRTMFGIGDACVEADMVKEAIGVLHRVLDRVPGHAQCQAYLALLYAGSNPSCTEKALDHAELACQFGFSLSDWQELKAQLGEFVKLEPGLVGRIMRLAGGYTE